jgi:hypothetical protein
LFRINPPNGIMKKQHALVLGVSLALAASAAHAAPIVGTFTGSAAGQGLDLEGNFDYALTMNRLAKGLTIGDAVFTDAAATAGVSLVRQNLAQGWYNPTYSGSAADLRLGQVMNSAIWNQASGGLSMSMTLGGLVVGNIYKVQLLFGEGCCGRGFDIWQDDAELVDNFSAAAVAGINKPSTSAVVSTTFMATATSVRFRFGGLARVYGDNNPILSAATLEALGAPPAQVPEPASFGLLAGGLGLIGFLRRKAGKR